MFTSTTAAEYILLFDTARTMAEFGEPFQPTSPREQRLCDLAVRFGFMKPGPGGVPGGSSGYELTENAHKILKKYEGMVHGIN